MKILINDIKYLREGLGIVSELVTEATLKITKDGMELIAMDPANVAMVMFKIDKATFSEYSIDKDFDISVSLPDLCSMLKRAKPLDTLELLPTEDKLNIIIKGASTKTFCLPLISLDDKERKTPILNFGATIRMASSGLLEAIEDTSIVGESASIMAEQDKFTIESNGQQLKAKVEILPMATISIVLKAGLTNIKSKYSIEYLKKMSLGSKLSEEVTISFDNDYPLKLEYKEIDKASLTFILAPRVEEQ